MAAAADLQCCGEAVDRGFRERLRRRAADELAPRRGGDGVVVGGEDPFRGFSRVLV